MTDFKEKGNQAYQAGEYSKAVDSYTEGIEQEPTNAVLFSNRSAAYLNLGEYDKAKRDAEMCIELDPKWSKGWWRKGTAQIENQDYKGARSTFSEGLKHCPGDSNLVGGVEKANKYIAVIARVEGPGELDAGFNIDGSSRRTDLSGNDRDSRGNGGKVDGTTNKDGKGSNNSNDVDDIGGGDGDGDNDNETNEKESASEERWPGTAEVEIERIKKAPNHYAVLHVSTDVSNTQMKKNYYTLARILHPDRCQLDGAGDAMTCVSQAYDALSNVLKKTLYDQFLSQTGGEADHPNQTYQEWESRQQPVELPKWLNFLLGIRGCGYVLVIIMALIMLPIVILMIVVYIVFALLWVPVSIIMRIFFPENFARMKEREERQQAKLEEETQDRLFAHV